MLQKHCTRIRYKYGRERPGIRPGRFLLMGGMNLFQQSKERLRQQEAEQRQEELRQQAAKEEAEKKSDRRFQLLNTLLSAFVGGILTLLVEHFDRILSFFFQG